MTMGVRGICSSSREKESCMISKAQRQIAPDSMHNECDLKGVLASTEAHGIIGHSQPCTKNRRPASFPK
jgi:hypothetical protein